jgi:hypothetical protein
MFGYENADYYSSPSKILRNSFSVFLLFFFSFDAILGSFKGIV